MRRAAALAALLLLLAACGRAPGLERLAAGEQGRVADVRAGDAFEMDTGLVVRLAEVEAPKGGDPYTDESRAELRRLADGRLVRLLYGGAHRDSYGRALAQVTLKRGGAWLQEGLLRAGAVRVRPWPDNRAMTGPLLEAEAYARNRRRGLWALPDYRVLVPREAADADGFQIAEGRIRRIDAGDLEFDAGFEAEIAAKALPDFKAAGLAPEALRGRLVRIRGVVRDGVMRLDCPEEVERLHDPG